MKNWLMSLLILGAPLSALAQQDPTTDAGFTAHGVFGGSDIDTVNMVNGNVMLHIQIASYPQRGGQLKFNISARSNNISWVVRSHVNPLNPNAITYYWALPNQAQGVHIVFDEQTTAQELVDQTGTALSGLNGIVITSPDGSSHVVETALPYSAGSSNISTWRALDASGYQFHYKTSGTDQNYGLTAQGTMSILGAISSGNSIQDTNGNQITQSSSGIWTDTMGRQFPATTGGGVTSTGGVGTASIYPGVLSATSTSDLTGCVGSPSAASTLTLPGYGSSSTKIQIKECYQSYTFTSNMHATYVNYLGNTVAINEATVTGNALHSILLPDGTSWVFDYDGQGNLETVTYPTGGTVSYTWNTTGNLYGGYIYIASRTVNDGTGGHQWTYSGCNQSPSSPYSCTVTDPNGNDTVHYYTGACSGSGGTTADILEGETDYYSGTGGGRTLLKKVEKTYSGNIDPWYGRDPSIPGCMNPVLTGVKTTLVDVGKVSQVTTTYDTATGTGLYYWNQNATSTQYPLTLGLPVTSVTTDYGSGSPGATIRQNATTYEWQSNSAFLTGNILSRVATSKVLDGSSNLCSETDMYYDQTTPTSSGVTKQHVSVTGSRGNLSTTTRQLSATPCQSGASWSPVSAIQAVYDTGVPYTVTDPGSHTTTYNYSSSYYGAYLTQTTLPSTSNTGGTFTHTISAAYDLNTGLVTSFTDQNGKVSTFTYDNMRRMLTAVMPDTDASGNHGETDFYYLDAVTIERKQRLHDSVWADEYMQLDGLARESRTMVFNDQSGNSWNQQDTCYDALGRVGFKAYPYQGTGFGIAKVCSGAGDTYAYDALNRNVSVTHSDGTGSTMTYNGAATDSVSEGNGTTTMERITQVDALGRLISACEVTTTALPGVSGTPSSCGQDIAKTGFLTAYAFDALGNMKSATQSGLAARTFIYDSFNRLTSAYNPESGTTTYNWNNDGELISRVRPIANTPGSAATTTTTYAYDPLHRVTSKTYSDGTTPAANFVYDGGTWLGQAVTSGKGHTVYSYTGTSATSPRAADVEYSFDGMGRVLKARQCVPGSCPGTTYEQDYTYNLLGGTTTATDGLSDTMTWTYNADAAVTEVQASFSTQPLMSNIQYGPFGMTNATLGNGHAEVDGYDARGRLHAIAYNNSSSQAVYSVSLNRSGDSSVTSAADSANGTWAYSYDAFNRLTSATASTGTYSGMTLHWTYDRYGNRLTQSATGSNSTPVTQSTYSFASNQISGFCYDSAGNLLDEVTCTAAGSNHLYTYDAEGRLIATASYKYEYSAEGTRISKDNSSGIPATLYLHDGDGNQIAELNASLAVQHVNVYSGKHLVGTYNPSTSKVYYAYTDWMGTKRYEADSGGAYVNSWSSLPFGDNLAAQGTGVDATEHHFTGKERDAESGLDYFKARYYQSQTGRWLLPDWSDTPVPVPYATFSNPQSLNLYTYVGNNPVNAIDADGHLSQANYNTTNAHDPFDPGCETDDWPGALCEGTAYSDDGAVPPGNEEAENAYAQQVSDAQSDANAQQAQQPDYWQNTYVLIPHVLGPNGLADQEIYYTVARADGQRVDQQFYVSEVLYPKGKDTDLTTMPNACGQERQCGTDRGDHKNEYDDTIGQGLQGPFKRDQYFIISTESKTAPEHYSRIPVRVGNTDYWSQQITDDKNRKVTIVGNPEMR
jgi:RHS repeat-associated protein